MTEELDSVYPKRTRRASNRIGTKERDEQDGWVFLSHGAYTCRGSASDIEEEVADTMKIKIYIEIRRDIYNKKPIFNKRKLSAT